MIKDMDLDSFTGIQDTNYYCESSSKSVGFVES